MRHHKDKFISPTIYNELRGLEVKKNGKVEHSDLTHDDQIFSYLMAMYVWYEGKNLRENFGIEKQGIKTEESVDDIVDLQGSEEMGDITEQIAYITKPENDKFEMQMAQLQKAKGILLSEFMVKKQKEEEEYLELLLHNPKNREALARYYGVTVDQLPTNPEPRLGNRARLPDSAFIDFNKPEEMMDTGSIYHILNTLNQAPPEAPYEDESMQ